ncbi:uncharacterized protein EV154DRAFT_483843 [Mucor mucedo]|uniref:uncharacterized protein n=1 Tax=Mucor mucedo TaxID=29922 RepID=UPI00222081FA|nr:uncharacterized protein EV154DRAFT_483843 [Mucor mucedo]KAI7888784.1 hypothetical protein EV154DRAFT_483843 [Mucor mucedo]
MVQVFPGSNVPPPIDCDVLRDKNQSEQMKQLLNFNQLQLIHSMYFVPQDVKPESLKNGDRSVCNGNDASRIFYKLQEYMWKHRSDMFSFSYRLPFMLMCIFKYTRYSKFTKKLVPYTVMSLQLDPPTIFWIMSSVKSIIASGQIATEFKDAIFGLCFARRLILKSAHNSIFEPTFETLRKGELNQKNGDIFVEDLTLNIRVSTCLDKVTHQGVNFFKEPIVDDITILSTFDIYSRNVDYGSIAQSYRKVWQRKKEEQKLQVIEQSMK